VIDEERPRKLNIPKVIIDPEFQDLIPMMTKEERDGLEKSILAEGVREPLVIWAETGFLVDGHRRYEICEQNKIEFPTVARSFQSRNEVYLWIINNQLSRRNITPNQAKYMRGLRYNIEKMKPGEHGECDQSEFKRTCERLAKEFGVSKATIVRDGKFAEQLEAMEPNERNEMLRSGRKYTKKNHNTPRDPLSKMKAWWAEADEDQRQEFMIWALEQTKKEVAA
jgi:hypothetical protein